MKELLTFIFLLSFNAAWSQTSTNEKKFLTWFFKDQVKNQKEFLYLPDQDKREIDIMRKAFLPDTLNDILGIASPGQEMNKLVLTKKEKGYINNEIDKMETGIWPNHILLNAKIIERDTIDFYLKDKGWGWIKLYAKNIHGFYSLTRPVFLRNGTICIFRYGYSCGSMCGQGGISVYRKDKTGWKHFINLYNWMS